MIKHFVMFQVIDYMDELDKKRKALKIKSIFENLPEKIKEITFYEVGINISSSPNAYDVIINSEFDSLEDLKTYSAHPAHRAAVEENARISKIKAVVDYEV